MCQFAQLDTSLRCRHALGHPEVLPSDHALIALGVLNVTLASRIVRIGQPVLGINHRPEVIEHLPGPWPWRADVQRFASSELHPGRHKVELVVAGVLVPDPQDVVLVRLQAGERHSLEPVHDVLLHGRRDRLAGSERQDP